MIDAKLHPESIRLIAHHGMIAHPEGGFFVETFRSTMTVQTSDGRGERSAITNILFLLDGSINDGISRLHRVLSDEVWHLIDGAQLTLTTLDSALNQPGEHLLDSAHPTFTVPAGHWQAAQTHGPWTLVGCTVGPGFDFADFSMLKDENEGAAQLLSTFPHLERLV